MLVGRVSEMRELEAALAAVLKTGKTRVVTVIGAAGIGKTRLVRDFLIRARVNGSDARVFRGSARDQGATYNLFARVLRSRFGLVEGTDAEAAKDMIRAQVAAMRPAASRCPPTATSRCASRCRKFRRTRRRDSSSIRSRMARR